jgi:hypothetical protein
MGNKQEHSSREDHEHGRHSSYDQMMICERDLKTLKSVLCGYLAFLRNVNETTASETIERLQMICDRLPALIKPGDLLYFTYEERIAIIEAIIVFKLLLVTVFPQTPYRELALADVERLYRRLTHVRETPLI